MQQFWFSTKLAKYTCMNCKCNHPLYSSFCPLYKEQKKDKYLHGPRKYNKASQTTAFLYASVAGVSNTVDKSDDQFSYLCSNHFYSHKEKGE